MGDEQIFERVDEYIDALYGPADPALERVAGTVEAAGMPQIGVSPVQGRLLHTLVRLCRAERVLELGTLGGYSTIWLARGLPAHGRLITVEAEPAHAEVAAANIQAAGLGDRVQIRIAPAMEALTELEAEGAGPFDVIFIDADKPPLADYFERALRLSRPGTLLIVDNVIRRGAVLEEQTEDESAAGARRFNALLARHPGVDSVIVQTVGAKEHDGIALAVVR